MTLFKRRKERSVTLQEVDTLVNSRIQGIDRNRDGTPDYLQRPELASIMKSNSDLNRWESDTDPEIERWIMGLRGYEFDPTSVTFKPQSPPTMNEIGIRKILTHIQTVVNKHGKNTNLKEEGMHQITEESSLTLTKWFEYNTKKAGISYSDLTPVIDEYDHLVRLVLSASIGDAQRKHVS